MIDEEQDENEAQDIPLPNVKAIELGKVIEFCKHYQEEEMKEIDKPLKCNDMKKMVQEWYADFVDLEQQPLFRLILAANYMDIKPLLELTCAKVASQIKGKTVEEIKKEFHIVNDFTEAEMAELREKIQWVED
mmetsp:Transcript_78238/g.217262  ORF Transcript_78238/g.217262 Transcript_78238/m.217262 type:complete len:133 (+) Transcript_78238:1-399(+)